MTTTPRGSRFTVDVSTDGVRVPLSRAAAARVVESVLRGELTRGVSAFVSVAFLSRRRIAAMNARHLRHAGPTDVISFGFARASSADPVVGDVYVAPEVARDNARAAKRPVREEIVRLLVHGTLHVLGHDHPSEEREGSPMWRRQERYVARLSKATL